MNSIHLDLLLLQALDKFVKKLNLDVNVPKLQDLYGYSPEYFMEKLSIARSIAVELFRRYRLTWWDVFIESDIGKERLLIAKEINVDRRDRVLDVGCGRGYFTYALSRYSRCIVGIDLMNSGGRRGWWDHFNKALILLGIKQWVSGIRANGSKIPFNDGYFNLAAMAHSMRNFKGEEELIRTLREMKRVVRNGGYVVIVENLPVSLDLKQYLHLKLHNIRVHVLGDELPYPDTNELLGMVNYVGFRDIEISIIDHGLNATPAIYYISPSNSKFNKDLFDNYIETVKIIRLYGEASTPIVIIKATV